MTFSPDLFTSIFKLIFILVNDKLEKRKLTFSPDLFTSIFKLFFILVNDKLAKRILTFSPDLLTVDLYSVHLLSRVDIVIRYIEVDFTFGLSYYVRYVKVLFHTFYCNFGRDVEYRSLYRGLR